MTELTDLSPTDASNTSITGQSLLGNTANMANMDDTLQAMLGMLGRWTSSDTIASAATTDIGAQAEAYLTISGTTTITAFGTVRAGTIRLLMFSGVLTLTHNATSLILPGAANITTAAGDTAAFVSEGSGNWRCVSYQKTAYMPAPLPKSGSGTGQVTVFSGADGAQWTLPAGGAYFYHGIRYTAATGAVAAVASGIGTAGGTIVGAGVGGDVWRGFSWRIS